jgi:hypothetical protein
MRYIDHLYDLPFNGTWKTQYLRFRTGRLKHQYWLNNRKNPNNFIIDNYDYFIVKNLNPGHTTIFGSAGYYLDDVIENLHVVEMHPVVKTFYPTAIIVGDRVEIKNLVPKCSNFIVNNNRMDHWLENAEQLTNQIKHYVDCLEDQGLLFYSFRDTQMLPLNRLTVDMEQFYLDWAHSLSEALNLNLCWSNIDFKKQLADPHSQYPCHENPDTTNGNLKFIFCLNGTKEISDAQLTADSKHRA